MFLQPNLHMFCISFLRITPSWLDTEKMQMTSVDSTSDFFLGAYGGKGKM